MTVPRVWPVSLTATLIPVKAVAVFGEVLGKPAAVSAA